MDAQCRNCGRTRKVQAEGKRYRCKQRGGVVDSRGAAVCPAVDAPCVAPDTAGVIPGSFTHALAQVGPRYVLFKVSGVIHGIGNLVHGDVTIAGQTSPGGVIVRGFSSWIKLGAKLRTLGRQWSW